MVYYFTNWCASEKNLNGSDWKRGAVKSTDQNDPLISLHVNHAQIANDKKLFDLKNNVSKSMIRTQCKVREQSHPDHTEHGTRSHIAAGYRLWEYLPDIRNIWKSQISDGTLRSQFEKLLKGLGCFPTRKSEILYRGYLDALLAKYDSSSKAKCNEGTLMPSLLSMS